MKECIEYRLPYCTLLCQILHSGPDQQTLGNRCWHVYDVYMYNVHVCMSWYTSANLVQQMSTSSSPQIVWFRNHSSVMMISSVSVNMYIGVTMNHWQCIIFGWNVSPGDSLGCDPVIETLRENNLYIFYFLSSFYSDLYQSLCYHYGSIIWQDVRKN